MLCIEVWVTGRFLSILRNPAICPLRNSVVESADLIIHARWIVPIRPANTVLNDHAIVVKAGKIAALGPSENINSQYSAAKNITLSDHVLMPGLINAHGHAAMTLLRGLADDLPLMEWLNDHIWPAEGRWVSGEFVSAGATLAMAEMLRTGTTTFSDMYFFPEATAKAAADIGMRCQIATPILDFPSGWAANAEEYIHKGVALADEYRHSELIQVAFGPHAPYTVSDAPMKQVATLANQMDAQIQIHLHETAFEVQDAQSKSGMRPSERLNALGLLTANTQCVHVTQLNDRDKQIIQESGAHIIHCPESNLKLASGICPIQDCLNAGINVALGTDGAASNNNLDMFGELQTAALLAKAQQNDASAVDAFTALELATINGARALGQEQTLGSLETGKWADMIAIDFSALELQPVYHVLSHLAYAVSAHHVSHSWVAGQNKLSDGKLTNIDTGQLGKLIQDWQRKISVASG